MKPQSLVQLWKTLSPMPGGKKLFSVILGKGIPYSGSMGAVVQTLEPGHCEILLSDRRAVRNHLNSIHAVAMMNLAELTSGLAVVPWLDASVRGILTSFKIVYMKKARGNIVGRCQVQVPTEKLSERKDMEFTVALFDQDNNKVAEAQAQWTLGPNRS